MSVALVGYDPLRDLRHRDAAAARECADWLQRLTLEGKAPRTLDAYEKAVALMLRAFPEKTLAEFTHFDIEHVLGMVPKASQAQMRVRLNSFFRWATLMDVIDRNPMDRVAKIRRQYQKVRDVFTEPEIALLIGLPTPTGQLFALLFDTGIRKAEARGLQRRHISLDRGELVVYHGKGGKDRVIPLTHRAQAAIADLDLFERIGPSDYLWYGKPGGRGRDHSRPVGNARFHRWFADEGIAAAHVPYRNPHNTRHTFATRFLRAGGRLERLSMLLGHASIKTTFDLYAHLDLEDVRADLALLEKVGT
jgi:integrase/recombinase XerD